MSSSVSIENVSLFYGDVLGVNKVTLVLEAGITGLVGPNGSGKSTLMNLIAGLVRPNRGKIEVFGKTTTDPESYYGMIGYCTQYDSFPVGVTGLQFLRNTLELHGCSRAVALSRAQEALDRVDLLEAKNQSIAAYSKGMRQRIKLAQSICHDPKVLVLDEPLNGLDPMARAQVTALFRELANAGASVIISSHILHEVDLISDRVVLLNNGYLVAAGDVEGIQSDTNEPMRIFIRSHHAVEIASTAFSLKHVIEAQIHDDRAGLFIRTTDADTFFIEFNELVLAQNWNVEAIGPADESVEAVYRQLIVEEQVSR